MNLKVEKIKDKLDLDVQSNGGFCSSNTACKTHVDGPGHSTSDSAIYMCGTWVSSPDASESHWW